MLANCTVSILANIATEGSEKNKTKKLITVNDFYGKKIGSSQEQKK